jgi:hypothetical protein
MIYGKVESKRPLGQRSRKPNSYSSSGQTKFTFAIFNNHWQGNAPRNAVDMMKALQLPFKELPMQVPLDDIHKKLQML